VRISFISSSCLVEKEGNIHKEEWISDQVGDDNRVFMPKPNLFTVIPNAVRNLILVIPECIYRESRVSTNPGFPVKLGMTEKSTDMIVELSFPRKRESRREWISIFMGMTKEEVIPAKAGIQRIQEEWIPLKKGMTENPGSRIKCGMTKSGSAGL